MAPSSPPVSPFIPPLLPARSPLRPPARSISSASSTTTVSTAVPAPSNTSTLTLDSPVSPQTPTDDLLISHFHMRDRHNSFPSLNSLIDTLPTNKSLALPDRPQTPLSINLEDDTYTSSSASSKAPSVSHPPAMSKRHHAMLELLSSERAYASDLGLISLVHIPLALGRPISIQLQAASASSPNSNANANGDGNENDKEKSTSTSNSTPSIISSSTSGSASTTLHGSTSIASFHTHGAFSGSTFVPPFSLPPPHTPTPTTTTTTTTPTTNSNTTTTTPSSSRTVSTASSSTFASSTSFSSSNSTAFSVNSNEFGYNYNEQHVPPLPNANSTTPPQQYQHPSQLFSLKEKEHASLQHQQNSKQQEKENPPLPQCMSEEDVRIIFSNVLELATIANRFAEDIERALGGVVGGFVGGGGAGGGGGDGNGGIGQGNGQGNGNGQGQGQGEDWIGALFLQMIPQLERPYKQYITRHPSAIQHLQSLPQTPALSAYLTYTQRIASEYSHAWDLASLLIKPVQRLLKYPLLLNAIIDETPDEHGDKERLRAAREGIEELARSVNEGRRRAEVVKDVLTAKSVKKPSAPVGVSASVNLSKVKSLRHGGVTAGMMRVSQQQLTAGVDGVNNMNGEAAQVDAMQNELKRIEAFAQQFARNVVDWGKMMSNVMAALRNWALSFGKVIGLSASQNSEAFDAFVDVIKGKLMPLTADLEAAVNERLLKDMAHLLMTMNKPLKLLASMNEQEPYHYHLLTMPVSAKNRPPPALLSASTNYLALRGQLASELPVYLALLHKGFTTFILRLSAIQTRFWKDVKEHWADLWEMLRVESELNVGWEETTGVWSSRWADVDEVVKALSVCQPVPHIVPTPRVWYSTPVPMPVVAVSVGGMGGMGMATASVPVPVPIQVPQTPTTTTTTTTPSSPTPKGGPSQFDEYFAYPGFYMPMTPLYSSNPAKEKERKEKKEREKKEKLEKKERERQEKERERLEREREGNNNNNANGGGGKLEKHSSKSSSGHGHNENPNAHKEKEKVKVSTVHSMFAALEPAHSPVHRQGSKQTLVPISYPIPQTPTQGRGFNLSQSQSQSQSSASLGLAPGGGAGGSYLVSGPMPLGYHHHHPQQQYDARGRGPIRSDAASGSGSNGSGSGSGSRRPRPSSQDSGVLPRRGQRGGVGNGNPNANVNGNPNPNLARRKTHGHGMEQEYAEYISLHGGIPPPYEGGHYPYSVYGVPSDNMGNNNNNNHHLSRMKSMPLAHNNNGYGYGNGNDKRASMSTTGTANTVASSAVLPLTNGGGYVVEGDRVYYRAGDDDDDDDERDGQGNGEGEEQEQEEERRQSWDEHQWVMDYHYPYPDDSEARGRARSYETMNKHRSSGTGGTSPRRLSKAKDHARKRSGSVKSFTSFFSGNSSSNPRNNNNHNNTNNPSPAPPPPDPQPLTASQRDSWVSKPAKYICQVIHPCKPPSSVSYYSFPFFTLREGDLFEVLQEAGHPSIHPKLPLYVDDGEDCLLLCRDGRGVVGWALASFLEPLSIG